MTNTPMTDAITNGWIRAVVWSTLLSSDLAALESKRERVRRDGDATDNEAFPPNPRCVAGLVPLPAGRSNLDMAIARPAHVRIAQSRTIWL